MMSVSLTNEVCVYHCPHIYDFNAKTIGARNIYIGLPKVRICLSAGGKERKEAIAYIK